MRLTLKHHTSQFLFFHLLSILLLHLHWNLLLVITLCHLLLQFLQLFLQVAFLCQQLCHFLFHINKTLRGEGNENTRWKLWYYFRFVKTKKETGKVLLELQKDRLRTVSVKESNTSEIVTTMCQSALESEICWILNRGAGQPGSIRQTADSHLEHKVDGASVRSDSHCAALWDGLAGCQGDDGLRVRQGLDL